MTDELATFVCPDCGATSQHPDDVRFRYCGRCHDFKGETDWQDVAKRTREENRRFVALGFQRPTRGKLRDD